MIRQNLTESGSGLALITIHHRPTLALDSLLYLLLALIPSEGGRLHSREKETGTQRRDTVGRGQSQLSNSGLTFHDGGQEKKRKPALKKCRRHRAIFSHSEFIISLQFNVAIFQHGVLSCIISRDTCNCPETYALATLYRGPHGAQRSPCAC